MAPRTRGREEREKHQQIVDDLQKALEEKNKEIEEWKTKHKHVNIALDHVMDSLDSAEQRVREAEDARVHGVELQASFAGFRRKTREDMGRLAQEQRRMFKEIQISRAMLTQLLQKVDEVQRDGKRRKYN
jgi:chromosome segregation ATPase